MTYEETLTWMFSQLPMYQRQGKSAFKKDMTNIIAFSNELGNPHQKFKSIHVGGTNGKGSTSHMIASILQESGCKVGLYTSPHLKNFTERIRINGEEISKDNVVRFVNNNKSFLEHQGLSFFEMTVAMAFDYFASEKVDVAIIEVGLGGRLDSTNIITPEVSIITNIGLDHTQFLGNTLPEIASEKAGIIKNNIPVIIGEYQKETEQAFRKKAQETCSEIIFASDFSYLYQTDLLGSYQVNNLKTAVTTINQLKEFSVDTISIEKGLMNVVKNTKLKGRWQIFQEENPRIICDTAHNKEGLTYVLKQLKEQKYNHLHIVIGMVSDKNVSEILAMFPKTATYYFSKPNIPRGFSAAKLKELASDLEMIGSVYESVSAALNEAVKKSSNEDLIYVGGSTFVVSEIL